MPKFTSLRLVPVAVYWAAAGTGTCMSSEILEEKMFTERDELATTASIDFEAPLGDSRYGKLAVVSGVPQIILESDAAIPQLLRAHFERPLPVVKARDGEVKIRYPSYSLFNWLVYWRQPKATITINASIPWSIEVRGGVSRFEADLSQVQLTRLDLEGGVSHLWATLSEPSGTVLIRIGGGVSYMTIHRPENIPVRIQAQGGISSLMIDEQHFGSVGVQPRLESPGYEEAVNRYEIRISGGVSNASITRSYR